MLRGSGAHGACSTVWAAMSTAEDAYDFAVHAGLPSDAAIAFMLDVMSGRWPLPDRQPTLDDEEWLRYLYADASRS